MHVGDSLTADIQGGINAELAATVWVNRNGVPLPSDAPKPSHTIAHVTELSMLLENLNCLPSERASFEGCGFALPQVQDAARPEGWA